MSRLARFIYGLTGHFLNDYVFHDLSDVAAVDSFFSVLIHQCS
ncbi:hypothetical protein EaACW_0232 [Erwinia amylovora ACW56400]|uniref:Uncharacterized protein n=2 Tax=Erwinia amylovora TaxID=552 RepID=A0A830ZXM4_ERWAM|nr:hypothetical protein EaACW_0232 [Erwinia amylovora ACW56400]CBX79042.1 hypothetical protein predicted by Glimmer/Critica [Erwinia amylovora ATCC BAA-2158]CCO77077.1 hypothetical protein BN432_0237 [Erwinia amylovora Ea356]CCO80859.1 hypothetical protein BN433_0244 [Erwinia amylovora Ea266]CCO88453.1 hypothetical protein BN435_0239 [Erwinia amylovora 01SFR-BO]CCO92208.1 hypothetical protein BN437_0236 [Erwinia amylovora NBRC 12687 = CFBP 1232]